MNICSYCQGALSRYDRQCSGCGAPNPLVAFLDQQIEALVARGQQALKQGQPADAIDFLSRAVAMEPEVYDAYFSMAAAWQQIGNPQRAIDCMTRAHAIRPGVAAIHYNIGALSSQIGQRVSARHHLWEAVRLLAKDKALSDKQQFFSTIHREMERLGPVTQDEITQIPPGDLDAEGHPTNVELRAALERLAAPPHAPAALRFYAAFARSFVLVPEESGGKAASNQWRIAMVTGPDRRPWFPAFTDVAAVRAFRPGASVPYVATPAVVIAKLALSRADTAGVVLNPTADGAGQPFERPGLEAIVAGKPLLLKL